MLKEKLESGHFAAGKRLTEMGIARVLSVSRAPVHEAMLRLEAEGLIRGNGAYGGKYVAFIEDLDPEQVLRQYELREVMEGLAAALAAKNMNGWQIDELRRLNDVAVEAYRSGDRDARLDASLEFHEYLVSNCGNELVVQVYRVNRLLPLGQRTQEVEDMIEAQLTKEELRLGREKHWQATVDAIASHDPEEAEKAARSGIRRMTEAIRKTVWRKQRTDKPVKDSRS